MIDFPSRLPTCESAYLRPFALAVLLLVAGCVDEYDRHAGYEGYNGGGVVYVPSYPRMVPVPGYPVYYDPRVSSNYFFYDGSYWAYAQDNWYASDWYNGPWRYVAPHHVPAYILRVPVRYYRVPPPYFRGWRADAPPHWGEHWGREWEQQRAGWDDWDRRAVPPPAPLPTYQQNYSGARYPHEAEEQRMIRSQHYSYQPRESETQQYWQHDDRPDAPRTEAHEQPGRDDSQQRHIDADRHADKEGAPRGSNHEAQRNDSEEAMSHAQQHETRHTDQVQASEGKSAPQGQAQDDSARQGKGHDKKPPPDKKQGHETDDTSSNGAAPHG